jgi:hypothetical protein
MPKTTVSKPSKVKYKPGTVELAKHEGRATASLLWRKILFSVTPEIRGMLLTHIGLVQTCERICPQPFDYFPRDDDERIRAQLREAETYLIGGKDTDE